MTTILKSKKSGSSNNKSIEEFHEDSKTWLSEIDFISYEIQFLKHLLSAKYIDFLDAGLYERIKEVTKEIFEKKNDCVSLKEKVLNHEVKISDLVDRADKSKENFLETHNSLALKINKFISSYKYLKMQIFEIVENTLEKNKQKKLT
ncbi:MULTISPECIES: hypothetical protein [Flavobacteriaceae]|uniref:Uncharacterized protein n=2 Tax=Flavobacteriaceae TaxID=49546 RepID=A0A4Y8AWF5_9FLAO|nr:MULTISPECIES: hypothetical protein [Flavobacteriaceae]TEW76338.1 hypothetical protein E2488_00365 [Gramella jeungdoensis]GGK52053.1 hypothetical protein GCM10007963_20500 [Lutibacter litoralis]